MVLGGGPPSGDARRRPDPEGSVSAARDGLLRLLEAASDVGQHRLPAVDDVAATLSVSRYAVLEALRELARQGRVEVRPGRGGIWFSHGPRHHAEPVGDTSEARTAAGRVTSHIRSLVGSGELGPGDRLPPAAEVADAVGVSRPAALAAFKVLADEGLLVVKHGRGGTWVAAQPVEASRPASGPDRERVFEFAFLCEVLEGGAARLAAERGISGPLLEEGRRLAAAMRNARDHDDPHEYLELETRLHLLVAAATSRPLIEGYIAMCLRELSSVAFAHGVPGRSSRSDDDHDALLNAIQRRDPWAAEAVAVGHARETTYALADALGASAGALLGAGSPSKGNR